MKVLLKGLYLWVLLVLSACQPEELEGIEQEVITRSDFTMVTQYLSFDEYSNNERLMSDALGLVKNENNKRTVESDAISVLAYQVLYIELGAYHSYTFKVDKEEELPLQNITFSLNDNGGYDTFLLTYDITQEELDAINNGIALDLEDKTIVENIDLDSNDFFTRSQRSSRMGCTTVLTESCVTVDTCSYPGPHPLDGNGNPIAGDNCTQIDGTSTVCTTISVYADCGGATTDDNTSGDDSSGNGGGGADSQIDPNDPVEEIVPCDTLPMGEGIDIGNGMCVVGTGLTGPLSRFEPTVEDILILQINALIEPNLNEIEELFLRNNIEIANEILSKLQTSNILEAQEYIRNVIDAGLNETLVTTFPLLKFPSGSNYETEYPKLTEILKEKIPEMANNETIVNAINSITEAPIDIIVDALQWGKGATVIVEQLGGSGDTEKYAAYRGHLDADLQDNLYLDIDLVNILEESEDDTCFSIAVELLVAVTILHEYTHLGDFQFLEGYWNDLFLEEGGVDNEAGIVFEIDAFGEALYLDNVELYAQNNGLCD